MKTSNIGTLDALAGSVKQPFMQSAAKSDSEGTRELVVRPNYIVVYAETAAAVTVLRVLHAAQMWP